MAHGLQLRFDILHLVDADLGRLREQANVLAKQVQPYKHATQVLLGFGEELDVVHIPEVAHAAFILAAIVEVAQHNLA